MGLSLHARWQTRCEDSHHLGVQGTPYEEMWRMQLQRHPIDVQLVVVLLSDLVHQLDSNLCIVDWGMHVPAELLQPGLLLRPRGCWSPR